MGFFESLKKPAVETAGYDLLFYEICVTVFNSVVSSVALNSLIYNLSQNTRVVRKSGPPKPATAAL